MLLTSLLATESEHATELPVPPVAVGLIALGLLMALLIGILMFGKGRPHS